MSLLLEVIREILFEIDLNTFQTVLADHEKLPFEELFQGSLRKTLPFVSTTMQDIKEILEEDYGMEVDVDNKKVYITRETRRGPQTKEMKLGKALNKIVREHRQKIEAIIKSNQNIRSYVESLKRQYQNPLKAISKEYFDVEDREEYLKETGLTKEFVDEIRNFDIMAEYLEEYSQEGSGYAIILSRAPIDVLRMSDFKNIQSCHSKGGSYWQCAVAEAQDGGGIAYLINKKDLQKIEDINQAEIFTDEERGIKGINPVSRLRLRNFVIDYGKDGEYELAVPEDRGYGLEISGFEDSILKWAREEQISDFYDNKGEIESPNPENVKIRGGAYSDTAGGTLLNSFFGLKKYKWSWNPQYENPGSSMTMGEQYEEEAEQYFDQLASDIEYVDIQWGIEDNDDGPFVWWKGYVYLSFPEMDEYIKPLRDELEKMLDHVNEAAGGTVDLDKYMVSSEEYEGYSFDITPDGGSVGHPDDFADFIRYCQDIDAAIPAMQKAWEKAFFEMIKEREEEAEKEAREEEEWLKKHQKY